jgi:hypothetical protein
LVKILYRLREERTVGQKQDRERRVRVLEKSLRRMLRDGIHETGLTFNEVEREWWAVSRQSFPRWMSEDGPPLRQLVFAVGLADAAPGFRDRLVARLHPGLVRRAAELEEQNDRLCTALKVTREAMAEKFPVSADPSIVPELDSLPQVPPPYPPELVVRRQTVLRNRASLTALQKLELSFLDWELAARKDPVVRILGPWGPWRRAKAARKPPSQAGSSRKGPTGRP